VRSAHDITRRGQAAAGARRTRPVSVTAGWERTAYPDWYNRATLEYRHIAIEGPIGVGKSALATRLGARLDGEVVLDETDNPFLADFTAGRSGAAFQAQLFSLLARHRQQVGLRQSSLFNQQTVSDYLFDKDKIYAYLNLDDNELFIYQRLYDLLLGDVVPPDLVIYLQIPTDVLRRRIMSRDREYRENGEIPPDPEYLGELNDAYTHFFFHYVTTPLLVVETAHVDLEWGDTAMNDLLKQVRGMGQGTQYYVPR
jgi:deoxyguanosine kinase